MAVRQYAAFPAPKSGLCGHSLFFRSVLDGGQNHSLRLINDVTVPVCLDINIVGPIVYTVPVCAKPQRKWFFSALAGATATNMP